MKKTLIFISLTFVVSLTMAQNNSKNLNFIIKWTPSKILEPTDPTLFLNGEIIWKNRLSLSIGYGHKCFIWENNYKFNYYFKTNAEFQYHFFRKDPLSFFTGINAFYINRYYGTYNGYVYLNNSFFNYQYAEKLFLVKGLYGLAGLRVSEGHFLMEIYAGIGGRKRSLSIYKLDGLTYFDHFFEWFGPGRDSYPGTDYAWHLSLGGRVGFVF